MPKTIQVRDVPDDVHRRLKIRATEEGRPLSDLIRAELVDLAGRPSLSEVLDRVKSREPVAVRESADTAIRAGRAEARSG